MALFAGVFAAEESNPEQVAEKTEVAVVEDGEKKDLETAQGTLGAYGLYGAGLGYGHGLGYGYGGIPAHS